MRLIYVASPYAGNIEANTNKALEYCRWAAMQGVAVVCPHLLYPQFLDEHDPRQRELACEMGLRLLRSCDELWAFGEIISPGMSAEIAEAGRLGIPVRFVMNHELGTSGAKYGVWAVRGGTGEWCAAGGVPLAFDSERLAQEYANIVSAGVTPGVRYYVRDMSDMEQYNTII